MCGAFFTAQILEKREDRLVQKGKAKVAALAGAFILTVVIAGLINRSSSRDTTERMAEASLPIVSLYYEDQQINELHGHTAQMNAVYMRDSITPLEKNRRLPIRVDTYGTKVDTLSYEIRSMDMERLVAEGEVRDYTVEDGELTADIQIQNIIEEGKEYLFILTLGTGSKEIYYYTRIIQPVDSYVRESLDFVMNFHNTTMNEETGGTLATYLEPDASGDNSTLSKVTIHSPLRQLTWADFPFERPDRPVPSFKEIDRSCNVITMRYIVTCEGDHGTEIYNVEEYYRVRFTSERIYLLNFERTMNRIFRGEEDCVYDQYVQLGIRPKNVAYASNENGSAAAFVQEGDLWSFNQDTNRTIQIFSFRSDTDEIDERENYDQHDIKIVDVDESGSVNFMVYGYMNRGIHEGRTGISVCHYDAVTNTVEEDLFLPVAVSYQVMKEDLGELAYQNNQKQFFLIAGGKLYQINTDTLETEEKMEDLREGAYSVSRSGRYIAYASGENGLKVEDLETGSSHEVTADEGEKIRPLGFIGEDLIYGMSRESDTAKNTAGSRICPMHKIEILSTGEEYRVAKTYEKGGYYIAGTRVEGNTIYLDRLKLEGGIYQEAPEDTIVNSEGEEKEKVEIHTTTDSVHQTQVQIQFPKVVEGKIKKLTSQEIVHEEPREVKLDISNKKKYYAYAAGRVILETPEVAEAVRAADEKTGVVIGDMQQYIWKRTKQPARGPLVSADAEEGRNSIAKCLNLILKKEGLNLDADALLRNGESPKEILEEVLNGYEVFDLTGCTMEQTLYYVGEGAPVFAMTGTDQAALIVGYDAVGVNVYEPGAGKVQRVSMEEAGKRFTEAGNIFYVYLKEENES